MRSGFLREALVPYVEQSFGARRQMMAQG